MQCYGGDEHVHSPLHQKGFSEEADIGRRRRERHGSANEERQPGGLAKSSLRAVLHTQSDRITGGAAGPSRTRKEDSTISVRSADVRTPAATETLRAAERGAVSQTALGGSLPVAAPLGDRMLPHHQVIGNRCPVRHLFQEERDARHRTGVAQITRSLRVHHDGLLAAAVLPATDEPIGRIVRIKAQRPHRRFVADEPHPRRYGS